MAQRLYDPAAPITVRMGALSLAVSSAAVFIHQMGLRCVGDWGNQKTLGSYLWPLLPLSIGLTWAWCIARMRGLFYWFFVVGWVAILFTMVIVVAATRPAPGEVFSLRGSDLFGTLGRVTWLIAFVMLVSKPSLRAYWSRPGPLSRPRG